ncbi:MAG: cyclic-di-AMP receptor, partial [Chloroflexota bacterium]|nr:cyclic-di-AMP receptor [Chloroflexota bacterium]
MPKLLIAVVHEDDANRLVDALRGAEIRVTEVLSRGGFLQARNAMLYIGVDDAQVPAAMKLIE